MGALDPIKFSHLFMHGLKYATSLIIYHMIQSQINPTWERGISTSLLFLRIFTVKHERKRERERECELNKEKIREEVGIE